MSNTDQDPSALTGIDELRFESGANSKPSRDPYLAALSRKPLNLNTIVPAFEEPTNSQPTSFQNGPQTPPHLGFQPGEDDHSKETEEQDLDLDQERLFHSHSDHGPILYEGPTNYDSNPGTLSGADLYKLAEETINPNSKMNNMKSLSSRFRQSGGGFATFQTAPSQPYDFQTAPSGPDQTRNRKEPEQHKLRRLFEENDLEPPGVWITKAFQERAEEQRKWQELQDKFEIETEVVTYVRPIWNEHLLDENDWCGRGMHVDFGKEDHIPLEVLHDTIGLGATATIDVVRCRGIKLARKTILLRRHLGLKDVLKEVRALHELRHAHVIRLVGTYTQGRRFNMLLYPVARFNLAEFLDDFADSKNSEKKLLREPLSGGTFSREDLSTSSLCLLSALRYVHSHGIKHMDIKPQNILISWSAPSTITKGLEYKMFLCDFGISHIFEDEGISQTSEYFGRTPKYAAPEVAFDQSHGRAADVFSLGCVLAEINTVVSDRQLEDFARYRHGGAGLSLVEPNGRAPTKSYHETIELSQEWVLQLWDMEVTKQTIAAMLNKEPARRPRLLADHDILDGPPGTGNDASSIDLIINFRCSHDSSGPEPYVYDKNDKPRHLDLPAVDVERGKDPKVGAASDKGAFDSTF